MKSDEGRRRMTRLPTAGESAGRNVPKRLKTAKRHDASSQAWLERQINDPFAAEARAITLGPRLGGWVQVAIQRGASVVVGVDLLVVDPLTPAILVQGDFTDPGMGEKLVELLGGAPDLVLSDMAPNTTGHRQTDHLRIIGLVEAAADFAIEVLKPGGALVAKAFQGGETAEVLKLLKAHFAEVRHIKPKASRTESAEVYLVATGLKRGG